MKVRVEAFYWMVLDTDSVAEAQNLAETLTVTHPQSGREIEPEHVGVWELLPTLADADPAGAAVVAADAGPRIPPTADIDALLERRLKEANDRT